MSLARPCAIGRINGGGIRRRMTVLENPRARYPARPPRDRLRPLARARLLRADVVPAPPRDLAPLDRRGPAAPRAPAHARSGRLVVRPRARPEPLPQPRDHDRPAERRRRRRLRHAGHRRLGGCRAPGDARARSLEPRRAPLLPLPRTRGASHHLPTPRQRRSRRLSARAGVPPRIRRRRSGVLEAVPDAPELKLLVCEEERGSGE